MEHLIKMFHDGLYYFVYEYNDNGGVVKKMDWKGKRPDKWIPAKSEFFLSREQAIHRFRDYCIGWGGKEYVRSARLFFIPASSLNEIECQDNNEEANNVR